MSKHVATFTGPKKICRTGKSFPLDCGGDGCNLKNGLPRPAYSAVPIEFEKGKRPVVFSSTLGVKEAIVQKLKMSDSSSANNAVLTQEKDQMADKQAEKEIEYNAASKGSALKPENKPAPMLKKRPQQVSKKPLVKPKAVKVQVVKAEESDYIGPVKSLNVLVSGKNVYAMRNNEEIVVVTYGKPVSFEAFTGNKNVGNLLFEVPDQPVQSKGSLRYTFGGNWVLGEKFPIIVTHNAESDKTEFKVEITLY